jgi:DNA (cytosine-5)-methyltransferase 1
MTTFLDLIEEEPTDVPWQSHAETRKLISMMSELNREKLREAQRSGEFRVGTIYKRTRRDEAGRKVQRAEARFDGLAGCLRTPAGGSSRQLVIVVEGRKVRSRLISSRETARLMGLRDSYTLPNNYNEAYHLTGDGVVVPVVRHLVSKVVAPVLAQAAAEVGVS